MPSFILRQIDQEFWNKVKSKAALEQRTIKTVIFELLTKWLKEKKS